MVRQDQGGCNGGSGPRAWSLRVMTMDHIHNEAVLAFLQAHKDNPNVQRFLAKEKDAMEALNKEIGTEYKDFFDYLEDNIGDDASWTMEELKALLRPRFEVELFQKERREFGYDEVYLVVDDLIRPVYIKDEGDFFTVWEKDGRVDIPVRLLGKFIAFLRENKVPYESEYDL
ncbi:MAG: hypothetical protein JXM79_20400 [Sedimentisphaerales bacterium]|nr:hypothetical protein [Sedimentisphaerales bacterium]